MGMNKFYLYFTEEAKNLIVKSLLSEKNNLIQQGKYTDGVDDVFLKFLKCKQKKVRVIYI